MTDLLRYRQGSSLLLAGPGSLLFLAAPVTHPELERLFPVVASDVGLPAMLDALLHNGFAAMPTAVLAAREGDGVRVIVRGDLRAVVEHRNGETSEVVGKGTTTWAEFTATEAVSLRVDGTEPLSEGEGLPLTCGAALADAVQWLFSGSTEQAMPSIRTDRSLQSSEAEGAGPPPMPAADSSELSVEMVTPIAVPEFRPSLRPAVPVPATTQTSAAPTTAPPASQQLLRPSVSELASPVDKERGQPEVPGATDLYATRTGDIEDDAYGHLWESTVMRSVEDAAVRQEPSIDDLSRGAPSQRNSLVEPESGAAPALIAAVPPALVPSVTRQRLGDHDGSTIMAGELAGILRSVPGLLPPPPPPPPGAMATARLRLSTGDVVDFDRSVIIGRKPSVARVAGTAIPAVIAVPSPQQDISRSHIEFKLVSGLMKVVDLESTNGSLVTSPGGTTSKLEFAQELPIEIGSVVDLGDGVLVHVEPLLGVADGA